MPKRLSGGASFEHLRIGKLYDIIGKPTHGSYTTEEGIFEGFFQGIEDGDLLFVAHDYNDDGSVRERYLYFAQNARLQVIEVK
jgi:hypothetical protein